MNHSISESAFKLKLQDFEEAKVRISSDTIVTPLLSYPINDRNLFIKAECLQPLGSFKIRAGANAIAMANKANLRSGVITASAGNFGQGVTKAAANRGLATHVFVPDTASRSKVDALKTLGAKVTTVSFSDWWQIMMTRSVGVDGFFIHPVAELEVIIGNGVIGLEIAAQYPDVDVIVVPFGGGGMISGIALAMKALGKSPAIVACEIESSAPLSAAKRTGRPVKVERGKSWVDGIGSTSVLNEMWPLLDQLVDEVVVVSHAETAKALRTLSNTFNLTVEGAGAVALAAALESQYSGKNVVTIISGGNINKETHARILDGEDS